MYSSSGSGGDVGAVPPLREAILRRDGLLTSAGTATVKAVDRWSPQIRRGFQASSGASLVALAMKRGLCLVREFQERLDAWIGTADLYTWRSGQEPLPIDIAETTATGEVDAARRSPAQGQETLGSHRNVNRPMSPVTAARKCESCWATDDRWNRRHARPTDRELPANGANRITPGIAVPPTPGRPRMDGGHPDGTTKAANSP